MVKVFKLQIFQTTNTEVTGLWYRFLRKTLHPAFLQCKHFLHREIINWYLPHRKVMKLNMKYKWKSVFLKPERGSGIAGISNAGRGEVWCEDLSE